MSKSFVLLENFPVYLKMPLILPMCGRLALENSWVIYLAQSLPNGSNRLIEKKYLLFTFKKGQRSKINLLFQNQCPFVTHWAQSTIRSLCPKLLNSQSMFWEFQFHFRNATTFRGWNSVYTQRTLHFWPDQTRPDQTTPARKEIYVPKLKSSQGLLSILYTYVLWTWVNFAISMPLVVSDSDFPNWNLFIPSTVLLSSSKIHQSSK